MIGVIYKLTIIAKVKYDSNKPFYVGQHWCKSAEDFLCHDYPYYGSGAIWNDLLLGLKKKNPNKRRYFVKREILCIVTNSSQKNLDRLEEFWIKREKAHYSYGIGGCNVLWGTANNFGSGSPMKDSEVRKKHSERIKGKFSGINNPFFGRKHTKETKRKMSERRKGRKMSEGQRLKMIEYLKDNAYWKGKRLTEEIKQKIRNTIKIKIENGTFISTKGRICITDGINMRYINSDEIVSKGWRLGFSNIYLENHKKIMNKHETRRKISENHANMLGENNPMYGKRGELSPMFRRKWITDGEICKFVDISIGIPKGFRLGRIMKGVVHYVN